MTPPPVRLPSADEVGIHLAKILARGSANLGEAAGTERLMLMLNRSCELRCSYCHVRKTEVGPKMPLSTATAAVDLLMGSERPKLELQLFGGEPTRSWPVLTHAIDHAMGHPARAGRRLEIILTTNGLGLDAARITWLGDRGARVLLSVDGGPRAHSRFRPVHRPSAADPAADHADDTDAAPAWTDLQAGVPDEPRAVEAEAWHRIDRTIDRLLASETAWFMNATVPPAAAREVHERYLWAQERGVPCLQLNYAVGMAWRPEQQRHYLEGLSAAMVAHRGHPKGLVLFNWKSECEPVMLSDDLIVDVDGTVLHDGAVFLERAFPELRDTYGRGHVLALLQQGAAFDPLRRSLAELAQIMVHTYREGSEQRATIVQNIELGAAVDWVIRRLRQHGQPTQPPQPSRRRGGAGGRP